jgi:hypothetical protein
MPKFLKDALCKYMRKAGTRTKEEQDEVIWELGFYILPPRDEAQTLEVVRSDESGSQFVRGKDEPPVRSELRTLRDRVIVRHGRQWLDWQTCLEELEVRDPLTPDPEGNRGGENDA